MRLVHLARASRRLRIERAGLPGSKAWLPAATGPAVALRRAVFAMPVVLDFWTTFQWLRELRQTHDERLVAVYFRVPDGNQVLVGRYNEPHLATTAAAAARWVIENPAGAEIVIPRGVPAAAIIGIRQMTQRVGWTKVPELSKRLDCVCSACLGKGDRSFMRRVRAAFAIGVQSARKARDHRELVTALQRLDVPLERARGRISPKPILGYARSPSSVIRQRTARLLGYFNRTAVEPVLQSLLHDDDPDVGNESVEALLHCAGTKRTANLVADAPVDVIAHFIEVLEYQAIDVHTIAALERYATHPARPVREAVARLAEALLIDFDGPEPLRQRLDDLRAC